MSAGGFRDDGLLLSVCESNNSGKDETQTASSSQASIKDRKEFRVKVMLLVTVIQKNIASTVKRTAEFKTFAAWASGP